MLSLPHTTPLLESKPANVVRFRVRHAGLALGLFLVIWSAKLIVLDRFGSDLPYWDQWAREGDVVYPAFFERGELWRPLFTPHNEHRIAPTLALNLGLVLASGQWDARVQCVLSAALHAAIFAGLFLWALRRLPLPRALAAGALLAVIGAAPIAWENVLGGFQSQFYFLAGFSLLAIGGLLQPAFSTRWWGGLLAGILSLVCMGSGFLCAVPVLFLASVRLVVRGGPTRRGDIATLLAAVLLLATGAWLHTPMPGHEPLHAKSLSEFFLYALRCLAWPLHAQVWLAPLFWLPWAFLFTQRAASWRKRDRDAADAPAVDFVIAGGLWVFVQVAAMAYSRGGGGELPSSRYGDLLGLGLAMSGFALALRPAGGRRVRLASAVWWLGAIAALGLSARATWLGPLQNKRADRVVYEQSVQSFVLTDDFEAFQNEVIPFPDHGWLGRVLRIPTVRRILPASVRAPLPIESLDNGAEVPAPPLLNRRTRGMLEAGEWQSPPLPAGQGWWKIETAGHLGEPGASLDVISLESGRVLGAVAPSRLAANSWRAAYVPAPREPAMLVARSDAAARWFAFSEPVEMSALSYYTWQLTRQGVLMLILTLVAISTRRFQPGVSRAPASALNPDRTRAGGPE